MSRLGLAMLVFCALFGAGMTVACSVPQQSSAATATDCPATQLSCVRQTPQVSDGIRPFVTDDTVRIAAIFPAGSNVCMARSGDSLRGYYIAIGGKQDCRERTTHVGGMGYYYRFNMPDSGGLADQFMSADCVAIPNDAGTDLRIANLPSMACQTASDGATGSTEILVYALAGRAAPANGDIQPVVIEAWLQTRPGHEATDLASFRHWLAALQVTDGRQS